MGGGEILILNEDLFYTSRYFLLVGDGIRAFLQASPGVHHPKNLAIFLLLLS
jgi:hypothetical protein